MLAVIVLSKDRPDLFRACADAVPVAPYLEYRLLVDNGESPGVNETSRDALHRDPAWAVLRGDAKVSFSLGNNQAERWLPPSVTHLLLLNNDCVLHPGCVHAMWEARGRAAIVGAKLFDPDGRVNHAGVVFDGQGWAQHLGRDMGPVMVPDDLATPAVTFACVLVDRSLWRQLGGLSELYWYCFEDVDFCLRAREAGARCLVPDAARATHAESSTRHKDTAAMNAGRYHRDWVDDGRVWRALYGSRP